MTTTSAVLGLTNMEVFNRTSEQWKADGDRLCRAKEFYKAIECYDHALRRTSKESDAMILLLNRCHARVSSQHFDSALEDAKAVLGLSPGNEKALFRAARALYGLRRYKESAEQLTKLLKLFSKNQEAERDLQRCLARLREEKGGYDFGALLDEAIFRSPNPAMDRADYAGPIEVRQCKIESHGRGVFTTAPIKAGDLLLVEKAFCAVFPEEGEAKGLFDEATGLWGHKKAGELRADIATAIFIKLQRNPSLTLPFAGLYPGPEAFEELDENGEVTVDDAFVQHRIIYNAFAFSVLSKGWRWRLTDKSSSPGKDTTDDNNPSAIGMWLKASYINHSCYANVRRSFIGDLMVWRAQTDIAADTELKFGYISGAQDYKGRQGILAKYGFECECQICLSEKNTKAAKVKERDMVMLEIIQTFEKPTATDIDVYFALLDRIQSTYTFSPSQEPRRCLIIPIVNLMNVCRIEKLLSPLLKLGITLLQALGFELDVTLSSWKIKTWGYICDDIVPVLAAMWQACGTVQPKLCKGLERDVKQAYTIMAGEVESFEGEYSEWRPKDLEWMMEQMEDMDLQEIASLQGLETVEAMVKRTKFGEEK